MVDAGVKTGIRIRYEDPQAVGADRVADAVAVIKLYGGPACVIDFGTATTFNAVTKDGDYLGGAITAGVNLAAEALFTRAAKLPRMDLQRPPSVIGRNTVHAMQSGLLFGYVSMVEGMVARFRSELGSDMKVIATGGLAEVVAKETDVIDIISPWLTLDGLRIIWELIKLWNADNRRIFIKDQNETTYPFDFRGISIFDRLRRRQLKPLLCRHYDTCASSLLPRLLPLPRRQPSPQRSPFHPPRRPPG